MTPPRSGPAPTQSQALATFALSLQTQAIPHAVRDKARAHFLDALGVALASSTFDFGAAVLKAARNLGNGTEAHAFGSGASLPAASAALVNGTLAHGLDYDDTHIAAIYHASAPALATVLAAGEAAQSTGTEVLNAFVVALELGCRLAGAAPGEFHERGLHPTAMCGVFAATAASARLHQASHEALVNALGLAGSQAGGILELSEGWLKRLHPGWAAHSGLVADALGRAGFKGPSTVFEGPRGFYAAHLGHVPQGDKLPAHALGEIWHTLGIALKPYPCCHFLHGFVDAALVVRDQVTVADIERIDCPISPALQRMVGAPQEEKQRPTTVYQALFSVQWAVSLALVKGRVDLAAFHDSPLDDAAVRALAVRTFCVDDPLSDFPKHFPGEVRITLKDGRVITHREATSLGTPERPLSRAAIDAKFMANASRALGSERARHVSEAIWHLDEMPHIGDLLALCKI
ncbi:MAG: MmgE/PrpD family protein [Rhodoferax sp.]